MAQKHFKLNFTKDKTITLKQFNKKLNEIKRTLLEQDEEKTRVTDEEAVIAAVFNFEK